MNNKYKNMTKGFTQLSKTWYGDANLKCLNVIDEVTFGFYSKEGGISGEITVDWENLCGKVIPKIEIFSDAWVILTQFFDLINLLGEHDSEDPSPEEFCKYLLKCGFIDMSENK